MTTGNLPVDYTAPVKFQKSPNHRPGLALPSFKFQLQSTCNTGKKSKLKTQKDEGETVPKYKACILLPGLESHPGFIAGNYYTAIIK